MLLQHQRYLRDHLQGKQPKPLTAEEKIAAELLAILQKSDAPLKLFDRIV